MLAPAAWNLMLDALAAVAQYVSLHSAYSATGANEISGGSPAYARKAKTWNAASESALDDSNTATFDVPGGGTQVAFLGLWSAASAGTFYGMIPLGSTGGYKPFTVTTASDTVNCPSHGFSDGERVVFLGGAPAGLSEGVIYFVRDSATDSFKVAATSGGVAIDLTGQASAGMAVTRIVPETFNGQGTHQVTDTDIARVFG
ncbi:MAG TPA: hypothetical protein VF746_13280 [Longimicrobium sp.]|jgi:hypothetical protein